MTSRAGSSPADDAIYLLIMSLVRWLVRWATGKRLARRLPKLSLITTMLEPACMVCTDGEIRGFGVHRGLRLLWYGMVRYGMAPRNRKKNGFTGVGHPATREMEE